MATTASLTTSRFVNSYLAESVGYNNGHVRGIAHGIEAGKQG